MKNITLSLLLVALIVIWVVPSTAEFAEQQIFVPPDLQSITYAMMLDQDHLLIGTFQHLLYKLDIRNNKWISLGKELFYLGYSVDEDGNLLCAQNDRTGSLLPIYRFDEGTNEWVKLYEISVPHGNEYPGDTTGGYWINKCFYFLCQLDEKPTVLCEFDPKTGETVTLGDFGFEEDHMLIYTGDKLIALVKDRINLLSYLYEFDLSTKQIERTKLKGDFFYNIEALTYDTSTGTYYATVADPVNTRSFSLYRGSSLDTLELYITPTELNELLAADGVCYMVGTGRITTDKAAAQVERKLTIANFRTERDGAYIGKTNTDIFEVGCLPQDIFSRQIDNIDLVGLMATDDPNLATIKGKGYFVDLSGSDVLMAQANRLFPKLRDAAFTKDGKLAMWPIMVQQYLAGGEVELLAEHGLEFPATMDELLDQIDQLDAAGVFSSGDYAPFGTMAYNRRDLIGYVMHRFLFEQEVQDLPVNFDHQELRALLQRILDTVPKEDPYPMNGEETPVYSLYNVYVPVTRNAMPPVKIGQSSPTAIETVVQYVVINPYSKQKEEAMRYLEFVSQVEGMGAYAVFSDMMDPLPNQDIAASLTALEEEIKDLQAQGEQADNQEKLEELEEQRQLLEKHADLIGQEDIAAIQSFAPQMVIQEKTLEGEDLGKLMDQLSDGNITLDEFVSRCNRYVKMRTAEDK